ncbi:MAG TPA: LuxR C-terminal-related transcriptional regulator [Pseudonocardia sp.]
MTGHQLLRCALEVVEAADAAAHVDELPALVLPALAEALGAETASWTTFVGPRERLVRRHTGYPGPLLDAAGAEAFERNLAGFPLGLHTRPGGAGHPVRRSDLQGKRALHRSGMYAEVLRPLGAEELLATSLRHHDAHVCLSLHRSGRDFSDSSVELLTRLRPLLARRATLLDLAGRAACPTVLTPRQRDVLSLVGLGLTDAAIAHRLGCSPRTVDKHLEHIYRRLGVRGRAAATAVWLGGPPRR